MRYVVYEFAQNILPKGVFDWNDVFGTVIEFLISVVILLVLWRVISVAGKGISRLPIIFLFPF